MTCKWPLRHTGRDFPLHHIPQSHSQCQCQPGAITVEIQFLDGFTVTTWTIVAYRSNGGESEEVDATTCDCFGLLQICGSRRGRACIPSPSCPGEATKLCFAPMSRVSTSWLCFRKKDVDG